MNWNMTDTCSRSQDNGHLKGCKCDPKRIAGIVVLLMGVITISVCIFQYMYFHRNRVVHLSDYPEISADCDISDIHWKDSDYDYITGYLSIDGDAITTFPVKIMFYNDTDDVAFARPVKQSSFIEPEREQRNADEKDLRDFIYHDQEYIVNAGEAADKTEFYCLIERDNILRNYFKIGFLIDTDDGTKIVKTDLLYKYPDAEE